jgi:rhamnogalacturonan endolyase
LRVNSNSLLSWTIPSNVSSSCVTRSGVSCFVVGHRYAFDAAWLQPGKNEFELGLVPGSRMRVMYDALRLEIV